MSQKPFLTIKEVAKHLQIGERSVYRYIETKKIKATKIGGWRIAPSDLEDFVRRSSNHYSNKK